MTLTAPLRPGRAAALLILVAVAALLWLGPVSAYLDLLDADADELALKQQELVRYRALAREAEQPRSAPAAAAALFYPEIAESQAVALLQETVKSAAAAAQIQIQGLQVLRTDALPGAAGTLPGAVRIGLRVRASGDVGSLGRLLYALQAARPVLYPDNLQIQARPMQPAGAPALLDFQLDVSGFKAEAPT
ncbi:MAG: hypothetical protein JO267_14670 [Alphaproteobacteria bacterium]|nr:hypothetical protein [Alphaproteobacteria bacterium]